MRITAGVRRGAGVWRRERLAAGVALGTLLFTRGVSVNAQDAPVVPNKTSPVSSGQTGGEVRAVSVIPFQPLAGRGGPIISAMVNHRVSGRFLLDTASGSCVIRPEFAEILGLKTLHKPVPENQQARLLRADLSYVNIDSFSPTSDGASQGSPKVRGEFIVTDALTHNTLRDTADGIFGIGYAKATSPAIDFDFSNSVIRWISRGNLTNAELKALGFVGGVDAGIAVNIEPSGEVQVHANLEFDSGEKSAVNLEIDTGSNLTAVPKNNLFTHQTSLPNRYLPVGAGETMVELYHIRSICLGESPIQNETSKLTPYLVMAIDTKTANSLPYSPLGMDYLSHFHLLIDYTTKRMYLAPVARAGEMYPTEASRQAAHVLTHGIEMLPSAEGVWAVTSIEKESPFAKGGVIVGDVLADVNGDAANALMPAEVVVFLTSEDKVTFHFKSTVGTAKTVILNR